MIDFSWQNWLRSTTQYLAKRTARKVQRPHVTHVEGLEDRALLTAPVANPDPSYVVNEDNVLNGTPSVLANDTDVELDTIDVATLVDDVGHGDLVLNSDGTFTYTPDANFNGVDTFTYTATTSGNGETSAAATVTITVNSVADAPVATADSLNVTEDIANGGQLAGTDGDNDALTFIQGPLEAAHGEVVINLDGTYTYTPDANYNGPDSFSFVANDGTANSAPATITVTVTAANDAPTANAGTLNINEDTAGGGTLTGADIDADDLDFLPGTVDAAHGDVVINLDGTYTYTPDANYNGTDTFSFVTNDGVSSSLEAIITVTIAAVADTPVANTGTLTVVEDTATPGTLTGSDGDSNPLTYAAGPLAPAHGDVVINPDGTYTYTPDANFSGTDTFNFIVNDGTSNSAPAAITVTITAVNDVPVANNGTLTVNEDTPGNGTLTATDVEGSTLTYAPGLVQAQHGDVVINANGTYTYTPDANFNGTDTFSFTANDGTATSVEATITVTITAVNDAPVAASATYTFNEDSVFGGVLAATDVDGNPLTYAAGAVVAANGTVIVAANGFFIYTPNANFAGTDTFSFVANDGTVNSAPGTINITVTAVNDAPVATAASITTDINTAFNGQLAGTDVEGSALTFLGGTVLPAHGAVIINPNGTYTYTPTNGYVGPDSFSFRVNDGTANSAEATITVTVEALNSAPTVTNGTGTVNENAVLNGSVSTLGTDPDSDPLTYAAVAQPQHGTLVLSPDGTYVYTPTPGYNGPDSFTFKANDGALDSNVGTVNITVVSVDSPMVLTLPNGATSVPKTSTKVQIDAGAAVADPDTTVNYVNSQITVAIPTIPAADASNGRVTISVRNQGTGSGLVKVKGTKISFNGSSTTVATITGGTKGNPLVITFTSAATEAAVNAVLKQISVQASKKATSGTYAVNFSVTAGSQTANASKNVVIA